MIHYELIFLYIVGFSPEEAHHIFGFSRSSSYRFYKIYRDARLRLRNRVLDPNRVPSSGTKTGKKAKVKVWDVEKERYLTPDEVGTVTSNC